MKPSTMPLRVLPVSRVATAGHHSTGAEADLRLNVKAKHPTPKHHQIIRAEQNKNITGAGPMR